MKALNESLRLVKEAVESKKNFEPFYDFLICAAPTEQERNIIISIRDDKIKHDKIFIKIYRDFTGIQLDVTVDKTFKTSESYIINIKRGLFEALKDVERDRKIRKGLPQRYYRDMLFETITDEFKHANEYNFILSENLAKMAESFDNEQVKLEKQKLKQDKEIFKFIKSLAKREMDNDSYDKKRVPPGENS